MTTVDTYADLMAALAAWRESRWSLSNGQLVETLGAREADRVLAAAYDAHTAGPRTDEVETLRAERDREASRWRTAAEELHDLRAAGRLVDVAFLAWETFDGAEIADPLVAYADVAADLRHAVRQLRTALDEEPS